MSKFEDAAAFYDYFNRLVPQKALSELRGIPGYGAALPYDFLKELGYTQYVKPDVHTIDICQGLGLITDSGSTEQTIYALQKIASDAGEIPYSIDRMFWLIGSGNFFKQSPEDEKALNFWNKKRSAKDRRKAFTDWILLRVDQVG